MHLLGNPTSFNITLPRTLTPAVAYTERLSVMLTLLYLNASTSFAPLTPPTQLEKMFPVSNISLII